MFAQQSFQGPQAKTKIYVTVELQFLYHEVTAVCNIC